MEPELTPTQWIARCAQRLGHRWRTASQADLEEAAIAVWQSSALRELSPEIAAQTWLMPLSEGAPAPRGSPD